MMRVFSGRILVCREGSWEDERGVACRTENMTGLRLLHLLLLPLASAIGSNRITDCSVPRSSQRLTLFRLLNRMDITADYTARMGKLSDTGTRFVGSLSGWTATLLFMWMPVAQMWTNYLNPNNIKGLSAFTMLLAMIGNGLTIPRALFIRDLMWFTGSAWASFLHGWGNLACMYCFNSISREFFLATTLGLLLWLGTILWRDTVAHGNTSPLTSLKELVFGP